MFFMDLDYEITVDPGPGNIKIVVVKDIFSQGSVTGSSNLGKKLLE